MPKYADVDVIINAIKSIPKGNWSRDKYVKTVEDVPSVDIVNISSCKECDSIKISLPNDSSGTSSTMTRARTRDLPASVRRELETLTYFIRQCKINNRKDEEDHWLDIQSGYLQALVDVGIITESEGNYIKKNVK